MKRHTRIYLDYFGYDVSDFIPCECCGSKSVDVHHIKARGMGGDPTGKRDTIENLMALCRICHTEKGDKEQWMEMLKLVHKQKIDAKSNNRI
jgi:5-methylcytosine-specific restriction endonuclease McrA